MPIKVHAASFIGRLYEKCFVAYRDCIMDADVTKLKPCAIGSSTMIWCLLISLLSSAVAYTFCQHKFLAEKPL